MAKVTYVHFSANDPEFGIQFEADDGALGMVDGRAFADVDPALKDTVLKAAQAALDEMTGALPVDLPPSAVTTALMKARNARQEAAMAEEQRRAAEEARQAAEAEAEKTRAAIAEAQATHAAEATAREDVLTDLENQIRAKQQAAEEEQTKHAAEAAARAKALADLDQQLAAKRAEIAAASAPPPTEPELPPS